MGAFSGPDGNQDPHELKSSELYRMLRRKDIHARTIWKKRGGERDRSNNGFLRQQFETAWASLGTNASTQSNKIINFLDYRSDTQETQS